MTINDGTTVTNDKTTAVVASAVGPTVSSVSVPSNGTYATGQNLDFTVIFNEAVTVNTAGGSPQLGITIGSTGRQASLLSGSGTTSLTFRYTVQAGESDTDGILVGSLSASGATLKDTGGKDATLTLNSVGATTSVLVDAVAPAVSGITLTGSPSASDATIIFVVAFGETVSNVSTDDFTLTKGSSASGNIASVSASSGSTINVTVNNITGTGTLRLDLNGSTNISDSNGNSGPAAYSSGSSHSVDRDAPTLSNVTMASNNTTNTLATDGDVVTLSFTASETLASNPTVTMAINGTTVVGSVSVNAGSAPNYTATFTVDGSGTVVGTNIDDQGTVTFTIDFGDSAGNSGTRVTTLSSGSAVTVDFTAVSYTHLRAHETKANLVCRLLLEKQK